MGRKVIQYHVLRAVPAALGVPLMGLVAPGTVATLIVLFIADPDNIIDVILILVDLDDVSAVIPEVSESACRETLLRAPT